METDQFPRFKSVMTGMSEVFQRELSNPLLDAYWLALRSWSLADFEAACGQLMQTATFMPRPVDFSNLRKAGRLTAGEAWAEVMTHVRAGNYGHRGIVVSELVDRCVAAIGGYHMIGMGETSKNHFLAARFNEAFEHLQDAEDVREAIPQVAYSNTRCLQGPQRAGSVLGRLGRDNS